jgi:hypothetical protein
MAAPAERSAFYALRPGGWRDFVTLLHPPYTAWHLSYVALGAAAAPHAYAGRVAATMIAFFLAVGIAAHALDELHGRPLGTSLSDGLVWALAVAGLTGALALGALGAFTVSPGLLAFMAVGGIAVVTYNLALFGGVILGGVRAGLGRPSRSHRLLDQRARLAACRGARRACLRRAERRAAALEHSCPRAATPHGCGERTSAVDGWQ